ncbi:MAG: hypothetical protein EOP04_02085 [Proteobacteria bacterium]|nr:MAG: hypothetical protein EOP04_02085 [Pseudomonadota bacterium]
MNIGENKLILRNVKITTLSLLGILVLMIQACHGSDGPLIPSIEETSVVTVVQPATDEIEPVKTIVSNVESELDFSLSFDGVPGSAPKDSLWFFTTTLKTPTSNIFNGTIEFSDSILSNASECIFSYGPGLTPSLSVDLDIVKKQPLSVNIDEATLPNGETFGSAMGRLATLRCKIGANYITRSLSYSHTVAGSDSSSSFVTKRIAEILNSELRKYSALFIYTSVSSVIKGENVNIGYIINSTTSDSFPPHAFKLCSLLQRDSSSNEWNKVAELNSGSDSVRIKVAETAYFRVFCTATDLETDFLYKDLSSVVKVEARN